MSLDPGGTNRAEGAGPGGEREGLDRDPPGPEPIQERRGEVKPRRGGRHRPVARRIHRLIPLPVLLPGLLVARDIGWQRWHPVAIEYLADRPAALQFDDSPALSRDGGHPHSHLPVTETTAGAGPAALRRPRQRLPTQGIQGLEKEQFHRTPLGLEAPQEPRRDHARIVDDEHISWSEK